MKKRKKKRAVLIIIFFILGVFTFCYWQNNDIVSTRIVYSNARITDTFDGYTIVQISDLHNKNFGKKQSRLLNKITKEDPDMIVVTGDLVDSRHTDMDIAMDFIRGAVEIAPVYYVTGNHEAWISEFTVFIDHLQEAGVVVLADTAISIEKNGARMNLIGLSDPEIRNIQYSYLEDENLIKKILKELMVDNQDINILLSHRPELIDTYADCNVDLVFSGHAHGGQVRLPWIGGLVAPDQGFFPKYTSGKYQVENTTMMVSRGLGNSIIPIRVFNRPEIIITTLQTEVD